MENGECRHGGHLAVCVNASGFGYGRWWWFGLVEQRRSASAGRRLDPSCRTLRLESNAKREGERQTNVRYVWDQLHEESNC